MREKALTLRSAPVGKKVKVKKLLHTGGMQRRLQAIGLVEGTIVECLQTGPSGGIAAYLIRGAVIALRCEDSARIVVEFI